MYTLLLSLHLLGATLWTGGHLVLSLVILPQVLKQQSPARLREFEAGFERIGMPALIMQILTGIALSHYRLSGAWHQHPGLLIKLTLLLATFALAAHAKFRVIPHLNAHNLPTLAWHIRAVTVLSLAFVITGVFIRTGAF
ncbi:CopD family protein [Balneatrix alpica]|uniref:CopD family protein n=1 Tax=Balneatrix alpica TaxID=75684 RepID=UPI0027382F86|nr:CopD family protein [Balneatrix alpica]